MQKWRAEAASTLCSPVGAWAAWCSSTATPRHRRPGREGGRREREGGREREEGEMVVAGVREAGRY